MKDHKENIRNLESNDAIEKLQELVKHNATCLFTTQLTELPLQTRPMRVQKVCDQGNFWFLSANDSTHNEQIARDSRVQLFFGNTAKYEFLTVYGNASISIDRKKIEELWSDLAKAWFVEGKEDPHITIIKVTPEHAFYWDTKDGKMISVIKIFTSAITGKTMNVGVEGKLLVESSGG